MKNLTLRQLRYFDALARHRHFGRAAEASAISQPALSEQIRDLERSLGAPLFERASRQVRVTAFGEELRPRVEEILRAVDELEALASSQQTYKRLRLGVIPTVAPYLLPTIVRDLGRAYPGLDIHVRETITPRLIEELARGRIDAAVVALPTSEPALEEALLFSEEFLLVRSSADRAAPPRDPGELAAMPLLLLEEGHCFRDQALAVCGLHPLRPREAFDASSLSTLVQMVGAGIGVTLIPEMAVAVETRSAPVAVTRFNKHKPSRAIGMVWRKGNPLAKQLGAYAEILRGGSKARSAVAKIRPGSATEGRPRKSKARAQGGVQ